jgi:hypothetical protein
MKFGKVTWGFKSSRVEELKSTRELEDYGTRGGRVGRVGRVLEL